MKISKITRESEIETDLINTGKKQASAFNFQLENFCKRSQMQVKDETFLKVVTSIFLISFGMNKGIEHMELNDPNTFYTEIFKKIKLYEETKGD